MKSFHITITDNDKGTVELDIDTNCICGAASSANGDGVYTFGYSSCDGVTLAETIFGALKTGKQLCSGQDRAGVRLLVASKLAGDMEEKKDEVDDQRKDTGVEIPFPVPGKNIES